MYRSNFKGKSQIELELGAFQTPFASRLNPENRWVKLSGIVPWTKFEEQYSSAFGVIGRQAYPFRMAIGALILQVKQMLTDRELVEQISENPYFQFFIGLPRFQNECPFDYSTLAHFRKRITPEMLQQMNDAIVASALLEKNKENNSENKSDSGDSDDSDKSTHQGIQYSMNQKNPILNPWVFAPISLCLVLSCDQDLATPSDAPEITYTILAQDSLRAQPLDSVRIEARSEYGDTALATTIFPDGKATLKPLAFASFIALRVVVLGILTSKGRPWLKSTCL